MNFLGKRRTKYFMSKSAKKELPLIIVADILLFPQMVVPFFAKNSDLTALEAALKEGQEIFLVPSKNSHTSSKEQLHNIGSVACILQTLKLPDNTMRVVVEGCERARLLSYSSYKSYTRAKVQPLEQSVDLKSESLALMQIILTSLRNFKGLQSRISKEKMNVILQTENPDRLVDLLVPILNIHEERQLEFFLEENTLARLENLAVTLQVENELNTLQHDIQKRVKSRLEQNQREYYLNEQLKEIHKELGHDEVDPTGACELKTKIESLDCPQKVKHKAIKECARLAKLQTSTPESGILRTYLEWLTELPWNKKTIDCKSLSEAKRILDEDHFDMNKVKERILDFLAIRQIQSQLKGPILCLVGPPGTGKTSLGRSVARALGRNFVRISLGGVRDEAEIRGHRKTYVGALPGKILQSMKQAESSNPVFLLDEIDKMASDFRGDPSAALLEVLDPEQNFNFVDHYLEVPYNLADVFFIATANGLHTIPRPLHDRMEVIEVPGYTDIEKQKIAEEFILPKQLKENGLEGLDISFTSQALKEIIRHYTLESGVRGLERQMGQVLRKTARKMLEAGLEPVVLRRALGIESQIESKDLLLDSKEEEESLENAQHILAGVDKASDYGWNEQEKSFRVILDDEKVRQRLGLPLWRKERLIFETRAGLANGLAWTEVGGKVLSVEISLFKGKGDFILTGSLGDVMKESARIACSFIKAHGQRWGLEEDDYKEKDIHIHFPEGSIPKDGPSAGITVLAALLSALRGEPLKSGIAMTGEVTLTGCLLPVGGIKEKILAAYRYNFKEVFLPEDNRKDLEEIPQDVLQKIHFHFASTVEVALTYLFPSDFFLPKKVHKELPDTLSESWLV